MSNQKGKNMRAKKMRDLIFAFDSAKKCNAKYIAVAIESDELDGLEIIINPSENFISKQAYYLRAYDNELVLKGCNKIKIAGIAYGNTVPETFEILKAVMDIEM